MVIHRLSADMAAAVVPALADLLRDVVSGGASIGFLPPLTDQEAIDYWHDVVGALRTPQRVLLTAQIDQAIVGTVQLDLASWPNARHRAEVMKLMVHSLYRQQGIGQALMNAIEEEAREAGRTTLVLDTRAGDPSEKLYTKLGYTRAGVIPEYARSVDGSLHSTVFLYKLLK